MTGSSINYSDNIPVSLVDRLICYIAQNPSTYCVVNKEGELVKLRDDAVLSTPISDKLVNLQAESGHISESFMKLFSDTNKTRLERMKVSGSNITDRCLSYVRKQTLIELDLSHCQNITPCAFQCLDEQRHLQILKLENCAIIKGYNRMKDVAFRNLRLLNIANTEINAVQLYCLMKELEQLTSLDVSKVVKNGDLMFLNPLRASLKSLVLHDCMLIQTSLDYICTMVNLRHLDISNTSADKLDIRTAFLHSICRNLPNLSSLDLSGNSVETDGNGNFPYRRSDQSKLKYHSPAMLAKEQTEDLRTDAEILTEGDATSSSIEGLRSLPRPLQFLGLLGCAACELTYLPAIKVAGEANEQQVLNAIEAYVSRSVFLLKALNVYFDVIKTTNCSEIPRAANIIALAMKSHPQDCPIQISGSASLYHISGETYERNLSFTMKRRIIIALLDAMENNTKSLTLQRNCCLTLYNFQLPFDLQFQYKRLAKILINIINNESIDGIVERLCVYMCNNIVCHVEGEEKKLMGELGVVKSMLVLIRKRVEIKSYDEVMETAWSTLWNVTGKDDTRLCVTDYLASSHAVFFNHSTHCEWKLLLCVPLFTIHFRSFEPIFRLVDQFHTPVCQYWSVWALTNLCNVDPDKYCRLLRKEGGLEKLYKILHDHRTIDRVRVLADQTINLNNNSLGPYTPQI
ncbi:protein zer-1 homolog [Anneissia japonica]|uniref:protein zer-1 homolog n=1 Tax=Anneissia japonica TaxID=1529436 RepID=UPI0014259F2B|nr:protein zer-1 homolog [Anneissia japonica]